MKCYIITFELASIGNYVQLYNAIKTYRIWARLTRSTWAIVTDQSVKHVRDHLGTYIYPNDRIFVVKSGGAAAWRNIRASSQWLKKHLGYK
ncbi:MAG TPA: hypothetical protein PK559_11415 [Ignavibacteriaceae bacterium]|nr:hypothetical protein [Ignavibacteriaceae bacterium]